MTEPYGGVPPRVAGNDTSEAAGDSMVSSAPVMRERVLNLLRGGGEGWTCEEVEDALDLRHQTASARIRELVLAGKAYDTGRRRQNASGRSARVYLAAP